MGLNMLSLRVMLFCLSISEASQCFLELLYLVLSVHDATQHPKLCFPLHGSLQDYIYVMSKVETVEVYRTIST